MTVQLKENEYNTECTISTDTYVELARKNNLVMTECLHKFSGTALKRWFAERTSQHRALTCPVCRTNISRNTLPVALKVERAANEPLRRPVPAPAKKEPLTNGDLSEKEALTIAIQQSLEEAKKRQPSSSTRNSNDNLIRTALELSAQVLNGLLKAALRS